MRVARLEQLSERERERLGVVVGRAGPADRYGQMQSFAARRLHDALEIEPFEGVVELERDPAAVDDRRRISRIEVDDHRGGMGGVGERPLVGVELQRGEVGEPDERGHLVDHAALRPARRFVAGSGVDPFRMVRWAVLLEEAGPVRTVRRPHQRRRPAGQMGEDRGANPAVVVDDLGFAETGGGVQDLVEVGDRELTAVDLDLLPLRHPACHISNHPMPRAIWTGCEGEIHGTGSGPTRAVRR